MNSLISVLLCSAAAVSGLALALNPQAGADHKIEILEKDIVTTRARTEEIAAELAQTRAVLEATVKYLAEQSNSAKSMAKTLDESEQAGFTWGINPDSRHILLKGWRDELAATQKNVPTLPTSKPVPKDRPSGSVQVDGQDVKLPGSH
jgi:hypothetical protein